MTPARAGLMVAVDVQHLYRVGIHAADRGTRFTLNDGTTVWEGDAALHYAQALVSSLRAQGVAVITNEPTKARLVGYYATRQQQAAAAGANVYLACHLNAGGGRYATLEYLATSPAAEESAALGRWIGDRLLRACPSELMAARTSGLEEGDRGVVCVRRFEKGPALVLEPLFGDNEAHQRLLGLQGLKAVGEAIAAGVVGWWSGQDVPSQAA